MPSLVEQGPRLDMLRQTTSRVGYDEDFLAKQFRHRRVELGILRTAGLSRDCENYILDTHAWLKCLVFALARVYAHPNLPEKEVFPTGV